MDKNKIYAKYFDEYHSALIKWRKSLPTDTFANRQMRMNSYEENNQPSIPDNFDPVMKEFYSGVKNWKIKWELNSNLGIDIEGTINILPIEEVLVGDTDFLPDEFPVMKNFTLLDHFYNEAAVGFYLDKPENGLYFFLFDGETRALNLDFKGYLEMLKYTKGAAYWQRMIFSTESTYAERIIENMTKLFPGEFTKEGFLELYESVRIDK